MDEKLRELEDQIKATEIDAAWALHDGDVDAQVECIRHLRRLHLQRISHQRLGKLVDLLVADTIFVQRPDAIRTVTHGS